MLCNISSSHLLTLIDLMHNHMAFGMLIPHRKPKKGDGMCVVLSSDLRFAIERTIIFQIFIRFDW